MTFVVLGATGLLGQALLSRAAELGLKVTGLARAKADVNIDITNSTALVQTLNDLNPDVIINAAALVNIEQCEVDTETAYLINSAAVGTLSKYCRTNAKPIKLVQISTDHFYTGDRDRLHSEEDPVELLNHYALTKFAGEAFARTLSNSLIIRTNIVGFRGWIDKPTFIEWAIQSLLSQQKMTLFTDFYTSSIDVKSCSNYIFDLVDHDVSGVINLAASECVSKAEFVLLLAKKLGLSTENCQLGRLLQNGVLTRANSLGLSVKRVEELLDRKMPTTSEVIKSIIEQYKG
jgi:dTDP-4-dehydrorhamnose reductase